VASVTLTRRWLKRKQRWQWCLRWRDPKGEQRWQSLGSATERVARAREADLRKRLERASVERWTDDAEKALERFLDERRLECEERTVDGYEQALRAIWNAFGKAPMRTWSPAMFRAFVEGRVQPEDPAVRPWSPSTVRRHVRAARQFIRWAPENDVDCSDFVGRFRGRKVERRLPRFLAPDELAALLGEVDNHETLEVPVGLGALAGFRFGEIRRLAASDVDWREKGLHIRKAKSHAERIVPISAELEKILRRHPAIAGKVSRLGNERNARRDLAAACHRAGIPALGWHALRHTFGSRLAEEGVPVHEIARLMGHGDINTTMIYVHARPSRLASAVEKVLPAAASR
jgi:integrase